MTNCKKEGPFTLGSRLHAYSYEVGNYFRHIKSDTVYEVVDLAIDEDTGAVRFIYRPVTGDMSYSPFDHIKFDRPAEHFFDRERFVPVRPVQVFE